ncbi:DUF4190 domain-containing protein [Clavibacter michiganensis subsp. phaseoli]|uniref:DUF4190 domain-containing protein n=1 Tax=Clavibacter phaseoli TaxID=1734031 RepID=A0A8I0VCE7_9MICO|nr:DUF4190 domain-containing protein [Clavibacter phaseoli]MBF4630855.1 DUF4190 domain-containing protein [Clavibacter phaseoli]
MSDDRDPGRTDGSHLDEPRDRTPGHADATGSDAAPAEPVSPYGPPAVTDPADGPAPATDADAADPGAAADAPPARDPHAAPPAPPPAAPTAPAPPAGYDPAGASGYDAAGTTAYAAAGAPGAGYAPPAAAPPYGAAPPYVSGEPPRPRGGKGLAIAALVVGIATFLGALIPFLNYVMLVPAVVAVVLGIVSLARRMDGKPLAVTGIVLGAVGFVLSVVLAVVYTFAFVTSVTDAVESSGADSGFASPEPSDGFGDDDATAQPGTSPDDPLPIGTPVTGEGIDGPEWEVTLGTPTLDATAAVLAADPTNEAPAEGMQYAVVPVTATYLGSSTGDPLSELAVGFLAADGSQYSAADSFVQAPAPAFTDDADLLEPQGTATGNVVIEIPIDGAEGGLWATAPGTIADAYYFRAG